MTIALVMGTTAFTSVNANEVWLQVNGASTTINITQDGDNNKVGASGQTFTVNGVSNELVIIQQGQYNNVGSVINMDGLNWGSGSSYGGDIYGDSNEFKIEQLNTAGTDWNNVGIHNYNQDGNSLHACQGKRFSGATDTTCDASGEAEYGGHTLVADFHGNNNALKTSQETGSGNADHRIRAFFYNGDHNTTFIKQNGNGNKTAYITIRTDGGEQSILQKDSGSHTATIDLTGSYKTDLDLTQQGSSNQSYTLTQNCQTSSGCSVTLTQGN
jgi:hypothetical protein